MSSLSMTSGLGANLIAEGSAKHPLPARFRFNGIFVISLASITLALITASECRSIFYLPDLLYGAVLWLWWGLIASIMWKLGPRISSAMQLSFKGISLHLLTSTVLGVSHLLFLESLCFTVPEWRLHTTPSAIWTSLLNINRFGIEVLIYGFVFGVIGVIQFQLRAQKEVLKSLALQKQLSEAHLRALQMQLEPHFLFNTLNAITTLVELGRQKEAAEMLSHLNSILKRTLKRETPEKIPLSQELEVIEDYLAIEQVRFADRLKIEMKIDPGALNGLVPCFLLQPIVENAIRHGIARREYSGAIEATAKREGGMLHLLVRDTGDEVQGIAKPGHGIGLKNTHERLTYFYQDEFQMKAQPVLTGGFEVAITIPYEPCFA